MTFVKTPGLPQPLRWLFNYFPPNFVIGKFSRESFMAEKKESKKEPREAKEIKDAAPMAQVPKAALRMDGYYVFVGKKGAMAYVLAVVTQFGMGAKEVIIKARGKSISRAVDVAEIVRNRDTSITLDRIGIATEEVVTMDGRPLKVSSIEIVMKK